MKIIFKNDSSFEYINFKYSFSSKNHNEMSWVNLLLKKHGKVKLLELATALKRGMTEKQFAKIFYDIYKIRYNQKSFKKLLENE